MKVGGADAPGAVGAGDPSDAGAVDPGDARAGAPSDAGAGDPSVDPALERLGWDEYFARAFEPWRTAGLLPGRVAVEHRNRYVVYSGAGELSAQLLGKLRREAAGTAQLPAVGDWVALETGPGGTATLRAVLPRRSAFVRKVAGRETAEQVVAANVDTVFLLTAAEGDLSLRRLERYLALGWESGASPVVVLTKADLVADPADAVQAAGSVASGVPVHVVSSVTGRGLEELGPYLGPGRTVALLGSSGVGKSTLVNRLLGREELRTAAVRDADGKGRHTTTRRELVLLPSGGAVIDTPGMRELSLWHAAEGMREAFEDVERLGEGCRFADCRHDTEPGCAVRSAVEAGDLPAERLESYGKLRRELARLERLTDRRATASQKREVKAIERSMRSLERSMRGHRGGR